MVAFETPSPCALCGRFTEDGGEVGFRVTELRFFFDFREEGFESHDGIYFIEAWLAEGGFKQGLYELDLFISELFEGDTFAFTWDEAPVFTFIRIEGEDCFLSLILVERCEDGVCSVCHFGGNCFKGVWIFFCEDGDVDCEEEDEIFHGDIW